MVSPAYKSGAIFANGVNLHYLDWGGEGSVLLFLAGWGCNSYIYTEFAPRFTDKFHVLALDRRGHGDSDHPETGYDLDNLTEDLRQAMDALEIDKAILVGHSLAGIELSRMVEKYPQRMSKLIYLDATYDYASPEYKAVFAKNPQRGIELPGMVDAYDSADAYETAIKYAYPSLASIWGPAMHEQFLHEITTNAEGKIVDRATAGIGQAIQETIGGFTLNSVPREVPVLTFFVRTGYKYFMQPEWMSPELQAQIKDWFVNVRLHHQQSWIEEYKRRVPQARVVEIPDGHHYCFIAHEELVYEEMRKFLGE